ncbi:uncharacterized protein LOC143250023 [Tachypleus tridentatus]|uniref:uncharacterized protein LOC143250023 n=1 Tax=Tachypleus tridentatus TaxID=6853 RepID=UPI003FD0B42E
MFNNESGNKKEKVKRGLHDGLQAIKDTSRSRFDDGSETKEGIVQRGLHDGLETTKDFGQDRYDGKSEIKKEKIQRDSHDGLEGIRGLGQSRFVDESELEKRKIRMGLHNGLEASKNTSRGKCGDTSETKKEKVQMVLHNGAKMTRNISERSLGERLESTTDHRDRYISDESETIDGSVQPCLDHELQTIRNTSDLFSGGLKTAKESSNTCHDSGKAVEGRLRNRTVRRTVYGKGLENVSKARNSEITDERKTVEVDQAEDKVNINRKHLNTKNVLASQDYYGHCYGGLEMERLYGTRNSRDGTCEAGVRKYMTRKYEVSIRSKDRRTANKSGQVSGWKWPVEGSGKKWYYKYEGPMSKCGNDSCYEILQNFQGAREDIQRTKRQWDYAYERPSGFRQGISNWTPERERTRWRQSWVSDGGFRIRRTWSDGFGLSRLQAIRRENMKDRKNIVKASSTLELGDEVTSNFIDRLKIMLQELRIERRLIEMKRHDFVRRVKQLHFRANQKRDQARDIWRKRYLEKRKETHLLEEESAKLRDELELHHRELLTKLNDELQVVVSTGKSKRPSNKLSLKIITARLLQEIEDIKRRVESTKIRLTAETKLRVQAQSDVKTLREELVKKKILVTLTKNEEQAARESALESARLINAV